MRDHISCGGRYLRCWPAGNQAERAAEQRRDWPLACRSMDRLHAYRDPDKISHRNGWRDRDATPLSTNFDAAGRIRVGGHLVLAIQSAPAPFVGITDPLPTSVDGFI